MTGTKRALVVGWFSFEGGHATAGDEMAADVLTEWLEDIQYQVDRAIVAPFEGDVNWQEVSPDAYDVVFFVCGPFERKLNEARFFDHFRNRRIIGVNLTLNEEINFWNPFDRLYERDSKNTGNPELAFLSRAPNVPLIGKCLVEDYPEGEVASAHKAIDALLKDRTCAIVPVDTRLDINESGLRSKAEVESVLARMDAVVTTRLHGMVLSLKNGVPVLPIDPKPGGGKIVRQAQTIGWPVSFSVDRVDSDSLKRALDFCLSQEARKTARKCNKTAAKKLKITRMALQSGLMPGPEDTEEGLKLHSRELLFSLLKHS